eukprot:CAMPEP_0116875178 /NCGR_PEP_ID=MMETSP0463-20121206/6978_1 /TAXON_ID=181622 /ORGANISM="Strombidinopsis sp, Strain SopsisLIS2011" /LENGTH=118 /DNA_ID=CAMNT_0004520239 /DNA_START=979 /DNA_END=1335 /DNA_ORIENTATION=+
MVPYIDSEFEHLVFDPDDMDAHIAEVDPLEPEKPADFDETNLYEIVNPTKQPDESIYSGIKINGLKHGLGRNKFKTFAFNRHRRLNAETHSYLYYEGGYKWDQIHGDGLLIADWDVIM